MENREAPPASCCTGPYRRGLQVVACSLMHWRR